MEAKMVHGGDLGSGVIALELWVGIVVCILWIDSPAFQAVFWVRRSLWFLWLVSPSMKLPPYE